MLPPSIKQSVSSSISITHTSIKHTSSIHVTAMAQTIDYPSHIFHTYIAQPSDIHQASTNNSSNNHHTFITQSTTKSIPHSSINPSRIHHTIITRPACNASHIHETSITIHQTSINYPSHIHQTVQSTINHNSSPIHQTFIKHTSHIHHTIHHTLIMHVSLILKTSIAQSSHIHHTSIKYPPKINHTTISHPLHIHHTSITQSKVHLITTVNCFHLFINSPFNLSTKHATKRLLKSNAHIDQNKKLEELNDTCSVFGKDLLFWVCNLLWCNRSIRVVTVHQRQTDAIIDANLKHQVIASSGIV